MPLKGIGFGEINKQYKLYPNDYSQGLLKTQQLYEDNKSGDHYYFGYLTELYFYMQKEERDHWRKGVADFQAIHDPIQSVIIAALTHRPDPIEIEWGWSGGPLPAAFKLENIKKGVFIVYDSATPKYYINVFGYKPPLTEGQAERLTQRAQRNSENGK